MTRCDDYPSISIVRTQAHLINLLLLFFRIVGHKDFQGDPRDIQLFFRGQELDDIRPLKDYPLPQGSVLTHKIRSAEEGGTTNGVGNGVDYAAVAELLKRASSMASARGSEKGTTQQQQSSQGWTKTEPGEFVMRGSTGLTKADLWDSEEEEESRAHLTRGGAHGGGAGYREIPLQVQKPAGTAFIAGISPPVESSGGDGHSPYASLAQLQSAALKRQEQRRRLSAKQREVEGGILRGGAGSDKGVQPIHSRALIDVLPTGSADALDGDEIWPSGIAAAFKPEERYRQPARRQSAHRQQEAPKHEGEQEAPSYEEEQRRHIMEAKAAFEEQKRKKQQSMSIVPRKPDTVVPYHASAAASHHLPIPEGGHLRAPARELQQHYVCRVGPLKHTFKTLHLLEGRWTGEARLVDMATTSRRARRNSGGHQPSDDEVKVCTVDIRFDDNLGVWHEHQSFTTKDGLVASQQMTLRPIGDGVAVVQLHTGGSPVGTSGGGGAGTSTFFSPLKGTSGAAGGIGGHGGGGIGGGSVIGVETGYEMLLKEGPADNMLTLTATSATTHLPILLETITLTGGSPSSSAMRRVRTVQKFNERTGSLEAIYIITEERVVDVVSGAMMKQARAAAATSSASHVDAEAQTSASAAGTRPVTRAHHGIAPSFMPEGYVIGPHQHHHHRDGTSGSSGSGSSSYYGTGDTHMFHASDLRAAAVKAERERQERERHEHAQAHLHHHQQVHSYRQQPHQQPQHHVAPPPVPHSTPSSGAGKMDKSSSTASPSGNPNLAGSTSSFATPPSSSSGPKDRQQQHQHQQGSVTSSGSRSGV
jgi:hypothetical protein